MAVTSQKAQLAACGERGEPGGIGFVARADARAQVGRQTRRARHAAVLAFLRERLRVSRADVAARFGISETQAHDVLMSLAKKRRVNHTALDCWEALA